MVSRRDFLKLSSIGLTGLALQACQGSSKIVTDASGTHALPGYDSIEDLTEDDVGHAVYIEKDFLEGKYVAFSSSYQLALQDGSKVPVIMLLYNDLETDDEYFDASTHQLIIQGTPFLEPPFGYDVFDRANDRYLRFTDYSADGKENGLFLDEIVTPEDYMTRNVTGRAPVPNPDGSGEVITK